MSNLPAFTALHNKSRVMGSEMRDYTIELERLLRIAITSSGRSVISLRSSSSSKSNPAINDYVRVDTWSLNTIKSVKNRVAITRIDFGVNGELVLLDNTEVGEIRF